MVLFGKRFFIFYIEERKLQMHNRLTVFLLTFSIIISLMLPISAALPSSEDMQIYEKIIRLHVIANSDTNADQALKLKVRDGILEYISSLVADAPDKESAEGAIREKLPEIKQAAQNVLLSESADFSVDVTLTKERYPTREYEGFTLPCGTYTSLRVLIGEAKGQNWWCVLFPRLCVTAKPSQTSKRDSELVEAGLTPSQVRIITGDSPDIVIKFRFIEFFSKLFS